MNQPRKTNGHTTVEPGEFETSIHEGPEGMPPAKVDDVLDALGKLSDALSRQAGKAELEAAQNREVMHRLANSLEKPKNGNSQWIQYSISVALIIAGWVYSGVYVAKTTETEIRVSNAIMSERLESVRSEFAEFKKSTSVALQLADERYRQLSIVLESRGTRLPKR